MSEKSAMDERKEYMEAHSTGLGGTDIAAITGMSPWKNPIDVYLGKLGLSEQGDPTDAMMWGNYMEEGIRQAYERRTGFKVERPTDFGIRYGGEFWSGQGTVQVMLHHPDVNCIVGSPDGLVPEAGRGLEIKTCGFKGQEWGKPGSDEIPTHYLLQVAQYMAITGLERWDLAVLFNGNKLEVYTVHRNRELEQQIIDAGRWFWEKHVQPKVPPPLDGSEACSRWLAKKYALGSQTYIDATPELALVAAELREVQQVAKDSEVRERLCKQQLAEFVGENKGAYFADGSRAQWIRPKPSVVMDWERYAGSLEADLDMRLGNRFWEPGRKEFEREVPNTPYIRLYEPNANQKRLAAKGELTK